MTDFAKGYALGMIVMFVLMVIVDRFTDRK